MSDFFPELRARLDQMPVVSVHEHHRNEAFQRSLDLETILSNSYAGWLGIPRGDTVESRRRYLEQVHANTYFFWLERALRDLYGLDEPLSERNWDSLSERIRERHAADPDLHWTILRERCRYEAAILDYYWRPGANLDRPDFYRPAYRINMFVMGYHPEVNDHNGNNPWERCGVDFRHVDEMVDWLDAKIGGLRAEGGVAVKAALAYDRALDFGDPPRHEAMRVFRRDPNKTTAEEATTYGDFLFNRICESCARHNVPLQVHTGLAKIEGSSPMTLAPTIRRHPKTRFALLHAGFPWTREVAGLARSFPNVLPDMTWAPLISTHAAIDALNVFLDATRSCEWIAWGGDAWTAEESCAALLAWKHVVASVLGRRVDCGLMEPERAFALAEGLMHKNARVVYGI